MSSAPHLDPKDPTTRADASARVARLYEKHGRMVYGICRAMLRDGHDAEDASQQTFLLAHRALLGGAHVRNEAAWLATIARNESRTRIAANMRSPLALSDEDLAAIPTTGDDAERSAQLEAIRSALADLPERQREAVVLRDLYGLRYGEVATALGLSRPATEALLFRARRTMRRRLKPIVATTLVVPIAVQEGLAQAIPGFTAASSGGVTAGVVGGGLLAKLAAGPAAVKVATAAVAVTTVGAVGSVESERAGRDRAERASIVSVAESSPEDRGSDGSGPGSSGPGSSGPGSSGSGAMGRGSSGSGRSGSGEDDDRKDDSRSGHGGSDRAGADDSGPGSGGDGSQDDSNDDGSSDEPDDGGGSSGPGGGDDDKRGDDSSRSTEPERDDSSGPSPSSGPGSGSEEDEDSSGSGGGSSGNGSGSGGSGDDDSGSEDSGSSGKGSSGESPGEPDD